VGTGWALVGRQEELLRVSQTLADPNVSGVVLVGPAGVGKTRLAQECLNLAERAGFATARVSATVGGTKIPFGALAALLPAGDVPTTSRGEFVRAAAQAIAAKGEGRPIVVMIDDAHHLDDASATLVHQLAFSGLAFVAVTVRTEFAVPELITDLWKDGIAERIDVRPLAVEAVSQMIDAVLGGPAHHDLTAHLIRSGGGNPLVLHELLLGERAASGSCTDGFPFPPG
jgi:predicted ATPase